jgi:NADPH:quinone reductase-like Zn-dependent oxidoreductase
LKAIVRHEHGGPEVLRYEEVDRPSAGPGELLVRVHAVSVNQTLDLGIRQNGAGFKLDFPVILGIDSGGEVEEVGDGVDGFAPGDRVTSILRPPIGGSYADYVLVRPTHTYHIPDGVSWTLATAVSRHFPMAYSLCRSADVKEGQWVLVMGAAGALGAAAVQTARHRGAHVIAAAGTDERAQSAMPLGAEAWVNYRKSGLVDEVRRLTDGKGVDVVLENIGDPGLWPEAFDSLKTGGTLTTVGAHGGPGKVTLDLRRLYRDDLTVRGGLHQDLPGDSDDALALAAAGVYSAAIHSVRPLSEAAEAHRIAGERGIYGKVFMDPTLDPAS